jgi:hypothetical protein
MTSTNGSLRPAQICRALLAALEAAEGRRKKRKRDQTPDAIGLEVKRQLLCRVVQEDPDPQRFEEWLMRYAQADAGTLSSGATSAMARAVFDEWRLAHAMRDFGAWLDCGAPSEDAGADIKAEGEMARRLEKL